MLHDVRTGVIVSGYDIHSLSQHQQHGPLFTKRAVDLLEDLVESKSRKIRV